MYIDFTKYFAWFRQFQGKKIVEKKKCKKHSVKITEIYCNT